MNKKILFPVLTILLASAIMISIIVSTMVSTTSACCGGVGAGGPSVLCGNGIIESGEQCERPNTNSNAYCPQTTSFCNGNKFATRSSLGNCGSTCQCVYTPFNFQCAAGQCGAICDATHPCPANTCSITVNDFCSSNQLVDYNNNKIKDSTTVSNSCQRQCNSGDVISGETQTLWLLPNADGDLKQIQWCGNNPNHYQQVDDPIGAPDDFTTYCAIGGDSGWETDLYKFSNSLTSGFVDSVTVHVRARVRENGDLSNAAIKTNGVVYYGPEHGSPLMQWSDYEDTWYTNPNTGKHWTLSDINNLQFGVSLTNPGVYETDVTQVYIKITYTPTDATLLQDCQCSDCSVTCNPPVPTQSCVAGVCGASCAVNSDCPQYNVCGADCQCHPTIACGNNIVEPGEQCELPNTNNNAFCTQNTSACLGNKYATRDSNGNCNANCACTQDSFNFQCVKGQCGAECAVNGDCANKCVGDTRYFGGTCSGDSCSCSYKSEVCGGDGWYDTCDFTCNGDCQRCKQQEYRDYSCTPSGCTYAVTNTRQQCEYAPTGQHCSGGSFTTTGYCGSSNPYCSGNCQVKTDRFECSSGHLCNQLDFTDTTNCPADTVCSAGTCVNNIACNVGDFQCTDECDKGKPNYRCDALGTCSKFWKFTESSNCGPFSCSGGACNGCDKNCGAQCQSNGDCSPNTCSQTFNDFCNSTKLVEYDSDKIKDSTTVSNSCSNSCQSCGCTNCGVTCNPPQTHQYCVAGVCGAGCAVNSDCPQYNVCGADCQCHPTIACGNNILDQGEQCELPNTNNNAYCPQTTTTCSGNKFGTRDANGNCDANCGCTQDSFNYQCVKGQCGAECAVNGDCANKCVGSVRYFSGQCNAGSCSCSFQTQDCSAQNGWFDTSDFTCSGDCQRCKQQEFRTFTCDVSAGCTYTVTDHKQVCEFAPTGQHCSGGSFTTTGYCGSSNPYCSGNCQVKIDRMECGSTHQCDLVDFSDMTNCPADTVCSAGVCTSDLACNTGPLQCTCECAIAKPQFRCDALGTCSKFWKFIDNSICNPFGCVNGACSGCDKNCGAQCESNGDCSPNTCSQTFNDFCNSTELVEYDSDKIKDSTIVTNSCSNSCQSNCGCTNCSVTCNPPQTHQYCVAGVCGAGCAVNSDCPQYSVCGADCQCHPTIACGNNILDKGEQCELPNTNNNAFCTQNTSACLGNKFGTRDANGNCDANCGCTQDSFNYQCVKGQCGAECAVNGDCANKCVGDTRYFGGTCSGDSCSCCYQSEVCGGDGWYDKTDFSCKDDCQRCKQQEYRNYYCTPAGCTYEVTDTKEVCEYAPAGQHCVVNNFTSIGFCGSGNNQCAGSCQYTTDRFECGDDHTCSKLDSTDSFLCPADTACSNGQCSSNVACNSDTTCKDQCTSTGREFRCNSYGTCSNLWTFADTQSCNPFKCVGSSCSNVCSKTCGAECETSGDCANKCVQDVRYFNGKCASDCSCQFSTENCNDKNGWFNTTLKRQVKCDDNACQYCNQVKQQFRDYFCAPNNCNFIITNERWVTVSRAPAACCRGTLDLQILAKDPCPGVVNTIKAFGLSGCVGKTVYLKEGTDCTGKTLAVCVAGTSCYLKYNITEIGAHKIMACVDINGNGNFNDPGETKASDIEINCNACRFTSECIKTGACTWCANCGSGSNIRMVNPFHANKCLNPTESCKYSCEIGFCGATSC
jgi:hypothetical protein